MKTITKKPKADGRKPVKHGLGYLLDARCKIKAMTRRAAQKLGDRYAAKKLPAGFWNAVVSDCGDYYRINIGGDPVRRDWPG